MLCLQKPCFKEENFQMPLLTESQSFRRENPCWSAFHVKSTFNEQVSAAQDLLQGLWTHQGMVDLQTFMCIHPGPRQLHSSGFANTQLHSVSWALAFPILLLSLWKKTTCLLDFCPTAGLPPSNVTFNQAPMLLCRGGVSTSLTPTCTVCLWPGVV